MLDHAAEAKRKELLRDSALDFAAKGLRVFRVHTIHEGRCTCWKDGCKPGKHPAMRGWQQEATIDEETIRDWWTGRGVLLAYNIGIRTGAGLVVVDVDGDEGADSLRELTAKYGELPATPEVVTPGEGRHLYFSHSGRPIPNSSGKVSPFIDIRGEGGLVVAPPSLHISGGQYAWDVEAHIDDVPFAPLPEWLVDLADPQTTPPSSDQQSDARLDPRAILDGVPVGERNDTVYRYLCRLRGKNLTWDEAYALGHQIVANSPQDPPFTDTEMRRCLDSAWNHPPGEAAVIGAEPDHRTNRFTIITGDDIENLPEPEWLIDGVLICGSLVVLFGESGSFKSFVALSMAGCISAGLEWQKRETHQGTVIYVAAEGVGDLGVRVKAFRVAHNLDSLPQVSYVLEPVNLFTDKAERGDVDALAAQIADLDPVLVIFDTLARSMAGGDENFAKDINSVIASADRLRHTTGATVMLIHHAGHDPKRERGSSALKAAADTVIQQKSNGTTADLSCTKQKTSAPFDKITVALAEYGDSLAVVSTPMTPEPDEKLMACVRLVSPDGISHGDWKKAFIDADLGSEKTFDRRRNALLDKGLVEKRPAGGTDRYFRTPAAEEALNVTGVK